MAEHARAVTSVLLSEWDELSDPPGQRWEIIGGELTLTPSASPDHNRAANRLWALIDDQLSGDLRVGTDLDWVLTLPGDLPVVVNAPRPDVVVWPAHHDRVQEPVLAVEVLSGSDRRPRIEAKRFAYAAAGLHSYLEVDLDAGVLRRYVLRQGRLVEVESGSEVVLSLPGLAPLVVTIDELRR